jgi:RND family efflux transporter MFP subunit
VGQNDSFVPGGFFAEGEQLLQIDRSDYEQALQQRQAEVDRAEAALEIELGDQAVAREELEMLEVDIPDLNRDLILRIPQVNQAKAQLQSARAALARAELDLARTRITAPFDGHVVDRAVTVGNNVAEGTELATLVGSERYWVELTTPVASLRWIEAPRPGQTAAGDAAPVRSEAILRDHRNWGDDAQRRGRVGRVIGSLEPGSRQARVLVEVTDPLGRTAGHDDDPVLLLDAFVEVEIVGRVLSDCFAVDRDLIRQGDRAWVMDGDDRLATRELDIAHRGRDVAWITGGLDDGDRVVRTNLQTPVEGMLLRVTEEPAGD